MELANEKGLKWSQIESILKNDGIGGRLQEFND